MMNDIFLGANDVAFLMVYFNSHRNEYIKKNFYLCYEMLKASSDNVFTIEISYDGENQLNLNGSKNYFYRAKSFLWHKENALNVLLGKLPSHITKVAWIDGDVRFFGGDLSSMLSEYLDEYPIVQIGDSFIFLDATGQVIETRLSMAVACCRNLPRFDNFGIYHCGLAWAARRDFLEEIGGFPELCICGDGDAPMATGALQSILPDGYLGSVYEWKYKLLSAINQNYCDYFFDYVGKVTKAIKGYKNRINYIPGTMFHYFHGHKKNRMYNTRPLMLNKFDKDKFLKDENGLLYFNDEEFQKNFVKYIKTRNEK